MDEQTTNAHHPPSNSPHIKKKKKKQHHEEHHEGEGPWIVSYADMMTLLFCFFVIMTSFANFDNTSVAQKSEKFSENFNPEGANDEKLQMEGLGQEISNLPDLKGIAQTVIKDGRLQIIFSSSILFSSGEIELSDEVSNKIDALISLIKSKNRDYRIIVEGHTDNSPTLETSNFSSNWDLSAARAASIVERFVHFGLNPKQIVAVGYGDSRPAVPNFDKNGEPLRENQMLNRRVIIRVLKPINQKKLKEMHDSFFDDNDVL